MQNISIFLPRLVAFEDRAKYYADMSFAKVPVDYLISKGYAKKRNNLISFDKVLKSIDSNNLEDGDTIYLTVADKFGNGFTYSK